jgi:hypothetical protein
MAFKKGSKEAKAYMKKVREAKINGLKKKVKDKRQLSIFDQAPTKKAVAPRKKAVTKKAVAPRKKVTVKKVVAPRKKVVRRNIEVDSNRSALPKGKRVSKNGVVYYEYRENHADNKQTKKRGQMLGIGNYKNLSAGAKKIWIDTNKKGYFKFNTPKFIFLQLYEDALSKGQYKKAEYLRELYLFAEDDKY